MIFTFGICTYNQGDLILETLESVKYQVVKYGSDIRSRLYIIDDCSSDDTVSVCYKWISENQTLFDSCSCIAKKENKGTVDSYNEFLKLVEGDYFAFLAGDDVIASGNYYEKHINVTNRDIHSYFYLELRDGNITFSKKTLVEFYLKQRKKERTQAYNLYRMKKGCYFHSPSTIITKSLYESSKCIELNRKFRLFEDDPTWYSILKNFESANVTFFDDILVLYRIHHRSVSNQKRGNNPFSEELNKLHRIYIQESSGLEKIYFQWLFSERKPWHNRVDSLAQKGMARLMYVILLGNKKFRAMKRKFEQIQQNEQQFYNEIHNRSESIGAQYRLSSGERRQKCR